MPPDETPAGHPSSATMIGLFARNLRRLRVNAGMTQEALASASGLDREYITRLEAAKIEPRLMMLVRLGNGLGVTPTELITNEEHAESGIVDP
jgi:transcriptional regulator with XRE-family HTH domain